MVDYLDDDGDLGCNAGSRGPQRHQLGRADLQDEGAVPRLLALSVQRGLHKIKKCQHRVR